MTSLLLFVFSTIGMTLIIVDSSIIEPIRLRLKQLLPEKVYQVFECYQCTGFWCGLFCSWVLLTNKPFELFVCACAGSFLASWGANYFNYLEAKSVININE